LTALYNKAVERRNQNWSKYCVKKCRLM